MHTTSGANGQYTIADVTPGTYLLSAVKDGYLMSANDTVIVLPAVLLLRSIVLLPDANQSQGAVYGIVTNSVTTQNLDGVTVTLYQEEDDE